jgi:hypothetical protein
MSRFHSTLLKRLGASPGFQTGSGLLLDLGVDQRAGISSAVIAVERSTTRS